MKPILRIPYILMLSVASLSGTAQQTYDAGHELDVVVASTFRLDTENNQKVVDMLQQIAKKTGDPKLLVYNDFLKKVQHWCFDTLSASKAKKAEQEIDNIADNSKDLSLRGHALLWKGGYLIFDEREYERGLYIALKGKKLLEEAEYEKLPYVIYYYYALITNYTFFEDFKSAAMYCKKSLTQPKNHYYGRRSIYNDLGTCYMRMGYYDSARMAFDKAIEASREDSMPSFEAMVRGNLGNLLRLQKNYKAALPAFYQSIDNTVNAIPEIAAVNRIYVADCLLHLDSVVKAGTFLTPPAFTLPYWSQPNYDYTWFETLSRYYEKAGNLQLALHYKDSLIALKDKIKETRDNKKIVELESTMQAEKFSSQRKRLLQDAFIEKLKRNIIIAALALILAGLLFWFNQRRKRSDENLARANHQLDNYLANIKEKNNLIEKISSQLQETHLIIAEEEKQAYIETLQKSVLLTEDNWAEFKNIFEQAFPHFFQQLAKKYPSLTPSETRLLALEKLNLPDKDMGSMLGISADSVRKTRYRLVKKYPELKGGNSNPNAVG